MRDNNWWAELRNDYIEDVNPSFAEYGDTVAVLHIDAWKTNEDNEEGETIAHVILSKSGDICVSYKNNMAYGDRPTQEIIRESVEIMKKYKE